MIDVETRLTDAAARLPGPDADATERARECVLAALAPAGEAPAGGDVDVPTDDAPDTGRDLQPRATRRPRRRRRILALGAGLATSAALAAAVVIAGLPHDAAPPAPPAAATGTGTAAAPDGTPRLDGVVALIRDDVLYTVTAGGQPVRIARLPALDDPRIAEQGGTRSLTVSPDGRRIAVIPPGGQKRTVSIYDGTSGEPSTIPLPPNFTTSQALFSVDGDTLFVRDRFDLYAVTDRARRIARAAGDLIAVAPDGSGMALNSADDFGLVVYDSALLRRCDEAACEAGRRTIVRNRTGVAGNVVWGPGADQPIAYVDRAGAQVVSAATPGAAPLLLGFDVYPLAFTPDGRELIVAANGAVRPLLEAISIQRHTDGSGTRYTTGRSRRLASVEPGRYVGMRRDGTAFVWDTLTEPDSSHLMQLVPIDGGAARPIVIASAEAVAWSGMTLPAGG